jgi:hypothetical protein
MISASEGIDGGEAKIEGRPKMEAALGHGRADIASPRTVAAEGKEKASVERSSDGNRRRVPFILRNVDYSIERFAYACLK